LVDWADGSEVLEFGLSYEKIRETQRVLKGRVFAPFDPLINRIAGDKNQEKSLGE